MAGSAFFGYGGKDILLLIKYPYWAPSASVTFIQPHPATMEGSFHLLLSPSFKQIEIYLGAQLVLETGKDTSSFDQISISGSVCFFHLHSITSSSNDGSSKREETPSASLEINLYAVLVTNLLVKRGWESRWISPSLISRLELYLLYLTATSIMITEV